jgi:uncharacterized membrane protein YdbT with pleckstrin-like domain
MKMNEVLINTAGSQYTSTGSLITKTTTTATTFVIKVQTMFLRHAHAQIATFAHTLLQKHLVLIHMTCIRY